jgi:hypothetical protein
MIVDANRHIADHARWTVADISAIPHDGCIDWPQT